METLPVDFLSALSDDLQKECGYSLSVLRSIPSLPPDSDYTLASAWSLAHSITKKFLPRDHSKQDRACLEKMLEVNSASRMWSLRLNTSGDEVLWGTFKKVLDDFFNPGGIPLVGSLDDIFLEGRCGPGASIKGVNGDFYSKMFASHLTCTSQGLVKHYKSRSSVYPLWKSAEAFRAQHKGEPEIVQSSKLSFVPKNEAISRSICTEPTLNMFYQLGLGRIIERRLDSFFGIDLSTQSDVNRELACRGSQMPNFWSTIDLESASDTISMGLCKEVLPPSIFLYLNLLRSRSTTYRGDMHELHMMSTMGNGYTFPLQTAIFAAMVKATYETLGIVSSKIDVFGDDIVVLSTAFHRLCRLLELAGCRVNVAKSFQAGPFKESCGHDYYRGLNIRGVYCKQYTSMQDLYALINLLIQFSARTGLIISSCVKWLMRRVDQSMEIPLWENPSGGIQMPKSMVRTRRMSKTTFGNIYSIYVFKARYARIHEDRISPIRGRSVLFNGDGLYLAFVSGVALSSGLPLREAGQWKKKRRSCSAWDDFETSPNRVFNPIGFGRRQWETAVYVNLHLT